MDFVGFDISTATYSQGFSVSSQETVPTGVDFSNDGTKMFIVGSTGDDVNEYTLSTSFDVSTATYSQNFSVSAQETAPRGIRFNNDGTKMFIVGYGLVGVAEYALSTAFDVSTASHTHSFSASSQSGDKQGLAFNSDGTKMYIVSSVFGSAGRVDEYALSTAFNVSTSSFSQSFSVYSQDTNPQNLSFNSNGTEMYVLGATNSAVYKYTLSTAFDVSTASYASVSFSVSSQELTPLGLAFNPSGTKMFIIGYTNDSVYEYNLDIVSLALGTGSFASADVGKTIEANSGVFVLTSTAGAFSETTAPTSYAQVASGSWEMYGVVYNTTDGDLELSSNVAQYQPISSTVSQTWSLGGSFYSLEFKPDGTKIFLLVYSTRQINEYALSTAWDLTTASLTTSYNITGSNVPLGMYIKPDGTALWITDYGNNDIEYLPLSTAWDLSSAGSQTQVYSDTGGISGVEFNDDGQRKFG